MTLNDKIADKLRDYDSLRSKGYFAVPDQVVQKTNANLPQGVYMETPFSQTLQQIANRDVTTLTKKDAEYGSSWKKRGGVGAFMMLARKWDRLETRVNESDLDSKYDIFEAITNDSEKAQKPAESTLETIRDLRRYLLLVESEILLRKRVDSGAGLSGVLQDET